MQKMKNGKKVLSVCLSLAMAAGMLSTSAFASWNVYGGSNNHNAVVTEAPTTPDKSGLDSYIQLHCTGSGWDGVDNVPVMQTVNGTTYAYVLYDGYGASGALVAKIRCAENGGSSKVELTEKEIETMIKNAVEGEAEIIAISPEMDSEATSLEVTFPKGAVDAILEETKASVSIQSDLGRVLLSRDVLTSISKTTEGGAVTVTVAAGKAENAGGLLKGQKDVTEEALKDCSVTEVTIRSGKEKVTAFGGKSITLYLPVENKAFEVGKSYVVYQISDDGSVEQLVGKCVKTGGKRFLELTTTHLSTFVALPVEVVDMPFTDVKEEDWFYGAVVYV